MAGTSPWATIRAANRAAADTARERIHTNLTPPALTGTPAQIKRAEAIRGQRIRRALEGVNGTRHGIAYALTAGIGIDSDPLRTTYVPAIRDLADAEGDFATEADLVTALNLALTHEGRTAASWWLANN